GVAVADQLVVKGDVFRAIRRGAGGDEEDRAAEDLLAEGVADDELIRGAERRRALVAVDAVAHEVVIDALPLLLDDDVLAVHEGAHGELALHGDVDGLLVAALVEAGEVQGRLAQGLRGNRAGVHARAAEDGLALDERHALAEVRRLRRSLLTR